MLTPRHHEIHRPHRKCAAYASGKKSPLWKQLAAKQSRTVQNPPMKPSTMQFSRSFYGHRCTRAASLHHPCRYGVYTDARHQRLSYVSHANPSLNRRSLVSMCEFFSILLKFFHSARYHRLLTWWVFSIASFPLIRPLQHCPHSRFALARQQPNTSNRRRSEQNISASDGRLSPTLLLRRQLI